MKKFLIILSIFLLIGIIYFVSKNSYEIVKNNSDNNIEFSNNSNNGYYAYDEDEYTIALSDNDGNQIVYSFDDDGYLENIVQLIVTSNSDEAKYLASYFEQTNEDSEISRIVQMDNYVSIVYNLDNYGEYKNMTKEEIKNVLLQEFEIIE